MNDMLLKLGVDLTGFNSDMLKAANTMAKFGANIQSIGQSLTLGVTVPLVGLAAGAVKAASDMQSLKMGLNSITGSSAETAAQLDRLKEVAKLPGLGFKEAVQGSINLQAAGFSAALAEKSLKAFGNALSAVGKGKADLEGVNAQLTQMIGKPAVLAEDLKPLLNRLPQINQMMKAAFGTSNLEDIQKLGITGRQFVETMTTEFGKLPQMTAGFKNSLENLQDTLFLTGVEAGDALLPLATRAAEMASVALGGLKSLASAFAELPVPIQTAALAFTGLFAAVGPLTFAIGGTISSFVKLASTLAMVGPLLGNIATAIRYNLIGALTGAEAAVLTAATGLGVGMALAVAAGFAVQLAKTEERTWADAIKVALGGGWAAAAVGASEKAARDAREAFQKEFGMPLGASESRREHRLTKPAPGFGEKSAEDVAKDIKAAFGNLGIKDLQLQITEASAAFIKLVGAGKLTSGQMLEAALNIEKLRSELAGLKKEKVDSVSIFPMGPTLDALKNLPKIGDIYNLPLMKAGNTELANLANAMALAGRNFEIGAEDAKRFGVTSVATFQKIARESEAAFERMRESGEYSAEEITRADLQMRLDIYNAQRAANEISEEEWRAHVDNIKGMLSELGGKHETEIKQRVAREWSAAADTTRAMTGAFNSLSRGLADNILAWKGWGQTIKNVGMNLASDLLSTFLKSLFEPLEKEMVKLAGKLGGVFDRMWGGSSSTPGLPGGNTPGAPSTGPGAALGAASTGLAGIVSAVSGAVTAVSSVVSNFQFAGMNKSLDIVVNHTLGTVNELLNLRRDTWDMHYGILHKMDDMWRSIREVGGRGNLNAPGQPISLHVDRLTLQVDGRDLMNGIAFHAQLHGV